MRLQFFVLGAMTAPARRFQIVDIPGSTGMIFDGASVVHDGGGSNPTVTLARLAQMSVAHEHLSAESSPTRCRVDFTALRFGRHHATLIE